MRGLVFYNETRAGILEYINDNFSFKYDDDYIRSNGRPISLTLPLRDREYLSDSLFPFFDGLLPEGYLLDKALAYYKLAYKDREKLIFFVARNPIGNISIQECNNND